MTANLHGPLTALISRPPVTTTGNVPLREALGLMAHNRVGSVVAIDPECGRPVGIFTLKDLLHRVAARSCDLDQALAGVMSDSRLLTLGQRASVYQAVLLMAREGIHHVMVVDGDQRLMGVISQEDIHQLQSGGSQAISAAIRGARDLEALVEAAAEIRVLAGRSLLEGGATPFLTELISSFNDHLTVRLIELTRQEFQLPAVAWAWLAFGSEGRYEQTLATDQDNGIVFESPADAVEEIRAGLLPFAREVNRRLDLCGYPLCKGNVMAGNPELCLSHEEWRRRYQGWLRSTTPKALLDATIYFDFRALYGAEDLATDLRRWLVRLLPDATLFLRFMAQDALRTRPPLGMIQDFRVDDRADFPHTIDLKANGTRLFVDGARILALACGIEATSTAERLLAAADRQRLGDADVSAMIDSFHFLQRLRLRQQQGGTAPGLANRVDPDRLNQIDRAVLRESLRQAGKLQRRIRLDYQL